QREKIEEASLRAGKQAERRQSRRAFRNYLMVSLGAFALGGLAVGSSDMFGPNGSLAGLTMAMRGQTTAPSSDSQGRDELLRTLRETEGMADTYQVLLDQERTRSHELQEQLQARVDAAASLEQEKTRNRELQEQLQAQADAAASLEQEKARNQE